jgi:predicted AAA+ superfamily ATPase
MDFKRLYAIRSASFFLFGPRGVGKSTWIRSQAKHKLLIDLLRNDVFIRLQRNPSLLESMCAHLKQSEVVFIDEIQKLPELLDEVHRLMEEKKIDFILTGSSARKLKKAGANLLGGRAHTYKMFPFSLKEIPQTNPIEATLRFGTLPVVIRDMETAEETLMSYVETYLQHEIKEEALVRRIEEFSRFISISAQLNGSVLNFENIARETGKSSKTVQSWYQILDETLLGSFVEPYRPGLKVRESAKTKFYWFDPGVARVAAGLQWSDVDGLWKGFAFEGVVLREIQTYLEVSRKRNTISYYGTPGAGEIDFILETKKKTLHSPQQFLSIEVKFSQNWRREWEDASRALKDFAKEKHRRMIGVYAGKERLTFDSFEVFPLYEFLDALYKGEIV